MLFMEKKEALKELTRDVHMPSFCAEEGYCEALDDCAAIDVGECSCCNINRIVRAFNRGIEFQKQKSNSSWISVEDDLPCNHEEMVQTDFTDRVLVLTSNGCPEVEVANMCVIEGKWEWNTLTTVLYWMPIPKPPKE